MPAAGASSDSAQTVQIVYLGKRYPQPPPLQILHRPPPDRGLQGAQYSIELRNLSGRLLGYHFELIDALMGTDGNVVKRARELLNNGQRLFIADLNRDDLLAVASLAAAKNAIFLNIHSPANDLRTKAKYCRKNIFHIIPSYAMRADALAQYLIYKRWDRWLLVRGKTHQDKAFAASIRRAAKLFGATIVDERTYVFHTGKQRHQTAHQQIATQMPALTRGAPEHDVVFVADESGHFGLYLPYRTAEPRPVVGSYGLTAGAWDPVYEKYAAVNLRKVFRSKTGRRMTTPDYLASLAVKLFGLAVIRGQATEPDAIRAYILRQDLKLDGHKPRSMSFRLWNQQLRQPILVSSPEYQVAIAPLKGFLNRDHVMDTLGFPRQASSCTLNSGG
ncbi:MAG: ABC transporter substrate-binding protein [Salinisphaera sp.]|nr:ABC transporter substrate-binding protein [Salinisphaera sp.]